MKGQYVMDQDSNRQRFAARLTALREALGLSRADVGAAVGVSGEAIRTWEVGTYAPRKKATVTKLEGALGARTGELWALLKGYEIPAKHPRRPDADTDRRLVDEIFRELQEFRTAMEEFRSTIEELRPGQNGEPRGARRGSAPREPVRQAS
jgi:transcriptional regulator with XRE-family HTH domain